MIARGEMRILGGFVKEKGFSTHVFTWGDIGEIAMPDRRDYDKPPV
jgi:hypothetical protein